jgi:2-oxoglutarate dehydrogenase E2 component (dihydrolipoamide succinyltransferase)
VGEALPAALRVTAGSMTEETQAPGAGGPLRREPMSRLRQRIAERLKEAQNTAAILTTFNEIDMQPVLDLRRRHQERFQQEHGIKLGLMGFFVKAACQALRQFPVLNARVEGRDIVYQDFYDIGVAVSSERGLVVPVLRGADRLSFAGIEGGIADFARRANSLELSIDELTGGTFTISNGGVFGSLLSTPILNPPQSGVLGLHKIEERPVAQNGEVVIRPMMYVALSYDHRIIDGREAVSFLVALKTALEAPASLLLEL